MNQWRHCSVKSTGQLWKIFFVHCFTYETLVFINDISCTVIVFMLSSVKQNVARLGVQKLSSKSRGTWTPFTVMSSHSLSGKKAIHRVHTKVLEVLCEIPCLPFHAGLSRQSESTGFSFFTLKWSHSYIIGIRFAPSEHQNLQVLIWFFVF